MRTFRSGLLRPSSHTLALEEDICERPACSTTDYNNLEDGGTRTEQGIHVSATSSNEVIGADDFDGQRRQCMQERKVVVVVDSSESDGEDDHSNGRAPAFSHAEIECWSGRCQMPDDKVAVVDGFHDSDEGRCPNRPRDPCCRAPEHRDGVPVRKLWGFGLLAKETAGMMFLNSVEDEGRPDGNGADAFSSDRAERCRSLSSSEIFYSESVSTRIEDMAESIEVGTKEACVRQHDIRVDSCLIGEVLDAGDKQEDREAQFEDGAKIRKITPNKFTTGETSQTGETVLLSSNESALDLTNVESLSQTKRKERVQRNDTICHQAAKKLRVEINVASGQKSGKGLQDIFRNPKYCVLGVEAFGLERKLPISNLTIQRHKQLSDALLPWAQKYLGFELETLPEGLRAFALKGGDTLDLSKTVNEVLPSLSVRSGRRTLYVEVRARSLEDAGVRENTAATDRYASGLGKLRVSGRYANVSATGTKSTTEKAKKYAGVYDQWRGLYGQQKFIDAMRTPRMTPADVVMQTCEMRVFNDKCLKKDQPLFRVQLKGPEQLVANWNASCDKFRKADMTDAQERGKAPFPVFIPTRGRPQTALLNWEAAHVLGSFSAKPAGPPHPVVCVVVEPQEEASYRDRWPFALFLVLPEDNRGPGYARWIVQRLCTKAFAGFDGSVGEAACKPKLIRLPWVWIVDDNVSMFYALAQITSAPKVASNWIANVHAARCRERQVFADKPMFQEAMLAVQGHPFVQHCAVAGFLRDDGTAACKKKEWKADERSLYKCVLLNISELGRLGVEYQKDLFMYEDVCLLHEVSQKAGRTLKCLKFCYRALLSNKGGCDEQRGQRRALQKTRLDDLIARDKLSALSAMQRQALDEVFKWVSAKERASATKNPSRRGRKTSLKKT